MSEYTTINPVNGCIRNGKLISDDKGVVFERGGLPWHIEQDGNDSIEIYYDGRWVEVSEKTE